MSTPVQREYLSVAQTAVMVRAALKGAFPGIKFSVRSKSYSGGASIDISWTDGPNTSAVDRVAKMYEGATFDGMIDLKSYHDTVLVGPDGPRTVSFGADFVFSHREVSEWNTRHAAALEIIRKRCALEDEGRRFGNRWIEDLASSMVRALDFTKGETLDTTFRRVVLRQEG